MMAGMLFTNTAVAGDKLPSNFFLDTLENGLEILVIEDNSVPLVTIEVVVRNGAYTETDEYDGLSHLYEHMFFKANKDIPNQEAFMDRVSELGLAWQGTTSTDRVNYYFTCSSLLVEEGLDFMNSAIRYPLFLEEEMKKENVVVAGEFQRNESNPVFYLQDDMSRALWGQHYSRKNTIGNYDIILSATPEKMRTIQDKYYYPNNSMLVVAGDVDHEDIFPMAESMYGDWEPSDFDPFEKWPVPEFDPLTEDQTYITVNENTRIPIIMMGWHGPDTRNDVAATYAADVFSFIVGQGASKLQQELVDAGLALGVSLSYATNKYTGPINLLLAPAPGKAREAMNKLNEHIEMWNSDDYFTDEQLQTAKTLLAITDAHNREATSEYVHTITYWWASADIYYYTNYVENLQAVSRDDIKRYVDTYIIGQPRVTGILVTEEMRDQFVYDAIGF
jgi:zinc protease